MDNQSEVKLVPISNSLDIPATGNELLSAFYIDTEAKAKEWAASEGILTVYWYEALQSAFGYVGK